MTMSFKQVVIVISFAFKKTFYYYLFIKKNGLPVCEIKFNNYIFSKI